MKFQVVMTVEIPDEDTLHDNFNMTDATKVVPAMREYIERVTRQPQRFTVLEANRIEDAPAASDTLIKVADSVRQTTDGRFRVEGKSAREGYTLIDTQRWVWQFIHRQNGYGTTNVWWNTDTLAQAKELIADQREVGYGYESPEQAKAARPV